MIFYLPSFYYVLDKTDAKYMNLPSPKSCIACSPAEWVYCRIILLSVGINDFRLFVTLAANLCPHKLVTKK